MKFFIDSPREAWENMLLSEKLLGDLEFPQLFFYRWKRPSITYGHFIDPKKFLHTELLEKMEISLAKRPTGGGIIFHFWDLSFCFLMPRGHKNFFERPLDNYRFVHSIVKRSIEEYTKDGKLLFFESDAGSYPDFCMAKHSCYDLLLEGKKIAGAAQRKTKKGYLHQGSIFFKRPDIGLLKKIVKDQSVVEGILSQSGFIQNEGSDENLKKILIKNFRSKN